MNNLLLFSLFCCLMVPSMHAQMAFQYYKDNDSPHYYDTEVLSGYSYIYVFAKGADDGGGSYTNAGRAPLSRIDGFNTTPSPQNGYVSYYFSNTPPVKSIKLAKNQTRCVDLANSTDAQQFMIGN